MIRVKNLIIRPHLRKRVQMKSNQNQVTTILLKTAILKQFGRFPDQVTTTLPQSQVMVKSANFRCQRESAWRNDHSKSIESCSCEFRIAWRRWYIRIKMIKVNQSSVDKVYFKNRQENSQCWIEIKDSWWIWWRVVFRSHHQMTYENLKQEFRNFQSLNLLWRNRLQKLQDFWGVLLEPKISKHDRSTYTQKIEQISKTSLSNQWTIILRPEILKHSFWANITEINNYNLKSEQG